MFSWFMGGDEDAKPIHPAVEKVLADAPELVKYKDQVKRTYKEHSTLCSLFLFSFFPCDWLFRGSK